MDKVQQLRGLLFFGPPCMSLCTCLKMGVVIARVKMVCQTVTPAYTIQ